jgi:hypothetical protein
MKWTRAPFAGRRDDGTPIDYTGYTLAGLFGVVRKGKRYTYYDVIHLPSRVSVRPSWLWLPKLVDAKAYAERVYHLQQPAEAWTALALPMTVADAILNVAIETRKGLDG